MVYYLWLLRTVGGQVRVNWVRLGQVRLGQARLGSITLSQVRLGQVKSCQRVFKDLFFNASSSQRSIVICSKCICSKNLLDTKIAIARHVLSRQKKILICSKKNKFGHFFVSFLIQFVLVRSSQVRLGQFRLGQVRLGQVRLGQVRLGQVRLGQVRLGQVRLGL